MTKKKRRNLTILVSLIIGIMLGYGSFHGKTITVAEETQTDTKNITPAEAFELIKKNSTNQNFVILDVRTPEEFDEESIENAININYYDDDFRAELNKLDKNKTYLVHCKSGRRSAMALDVMEELNFKVVYNMLGGIAGWKQEGLPTVK